ncbi:MAG: hypothetical protein KBG22_09210 [Smithella sp.]|nr:hypothetical protein [Smithella sp.]HQI72607.1 hypothetical protein [Smithella sp.]
MLISTTVIILGILLGGFFIWKRYRLQKENFQKLSAKLSATNNVRTFDSHSLQGEYRGRRYECRYFPGSKNSPPSFTISIFFNSPVIFSVNREGRVEKFSKNIGLTSEIQTGDPAFDSTFFINSDGEMSALQNYFFNVEVREAIGAVFAGGMTMKSISFTADRVNAVISPLSPEETSRVPVEMVLEKLDLLISGMPSLNVPPATPLLKKYARAVPVIVTVIILNITAVGLLVAGLNLYKPLRFAFSIKSFQYSIPAAILFLCIAFQMVKGRSSSHTIFIPLAIFSLTGFLVGGLSWMIFFNGYLDQGPVGDHLVTVTEKYYTTHKGDRKYYAKFDSWKTPGEIDKISVNRSIYNAIDATGKILIKTRPGYFAQEWLVDVRPEKSMSEQPQQ